MVVAQGTDWKLLPRRPTEDWLAQGHVSEYKLAVDTPLWLAAITNAAVGVSKHFLFWRVSSETDQALRTAQNTNTSSAGHENAEVIVAARPRMNKKELGNGLVSCCCRRAGHAWLTLRIAGNMPSHGHSSPALFASLFGLPPLEPVS
jgi:hypothetical protein